jgi:hypothetical protein
MSKIQHDALHWLSNGQHKSSNGHKLDLTTKEPQTIPESEEIVEAQTDATELFAISETAMQNPSRRKRYRLFYSLFFVAIHTFTFCSSLWMQK